MTEQDALKLALLASIMRRMTTSGRVAPIRSEAFIPPQRSSTVRDYRRVRVRDPKRIRGDAATRIAKER